MVGLGVGDNIIVCGLMIAPPIIVGAWPMAVLLWQHVECLLLLHSSLLLKIYYIKSVTVMIHRAYTFIMHMELAIIIIIVSYV